MGSGGALSFSESLVYSSLGITVVFLALVSLAIVIVLFSKIFSGLNKVAGTAEAPKTAAVQSAAGEDAGVIAAILAAVTQDASERGGQVVITSINEAK